MHIITWNLAVTNFKIRESLDYLFAKDPDIICLQEVKTEGLEYLKKLKNYQIYYTVDGYSKKTKYKQYLVILVKSQYKVINHKIFSFFAGEHISNWDKFMKAVISYEKRHNGMYLDLDIDGVPLRIFTFHLKWSCGPTIRFKEFENILSNLSSKRENILAGDLNIYSKWYSFIPGTLLFNYHKSDWLVDERKKFESLFRKYNFVNIFRGANTWPWIGLSFQLDHILVNPSIRYYDKTVSDDKVGSDHKIIGLKLDLKNYNRKPSK